MSIETAESASLRAAIAAHRDALDTFLERYQAANLFTVIAGFHVSCPRRQSGYMVRSEWLALSVMAGGVALVLIGMVVQVVQVNRADRARAELARRSPTRDRHGSSA